MGLGLNCQWEKCNQSFEVRCVVELLLKRFFFERQVYWMEIRVDLEGPRFINGSWIQNCARIVYKESNIFGAFRRKNCAISAVNLSVRLLAGRLIVSILVYCSFDQSVYMCVCGCVSVCLWPNYPNVRPSVGLCPNYSNGHTFFCLSVSKHLSVFKLFVNWNAFTSLEPFSRRGSNFFLYKKVK